jgi:hypothetical protein
MQVLKKDDDRLSFLCARWMMRRPNMLRVPIGDYGVIGNMRTCALVGRDGSIDWLCFPRFDSAACFAKLLGSPDNGRWLITPKGRITKRTRRYRPDTAILETQFRTETGAVTLIDFMTTTNDDDKFDVVRIVRGDQGVVEMTMELVLRFDYGAALPWVQRKDYGMSAIAGPNSVDLHTPVNLRGQDMKTVARFKVRNGESVPFTSPAIPPTSARILCATPTMPCARPRCFGADGSRNATSRAGRNPGKQLSNDR